MKLAFSALGQKIIIIVVFPLIQNEYKCWKYYLISQTMKIKAIKFLIFLLNREGVLGFPLHLVPAVPPEPSHIL